jgi:predicted small lipoprotein YifL
LTHIALQLPLVGAKVGTQNWIPVRAKISGFARRLTLPVLVVCAIALSACGRAGPLEPPPGPAAVPGPSPQLTQTDGTPAPGSPQDTAVKTGFDAQGNPVATPGQKRSFILDPLLQ